MGYIQEIRQMVGHYPVMAIGATVIVFNDERELLLNLRSDTKTWGIPGGAMEPGETIEITARRELYEETGLQVGSLNLLDILSGPEYFFIYPNGDQMHSVIVLFEAIGVAGTLSINDGESDKLKYFSMDNLPKMESRAAEIIKWMDRNGKASSYS